MPDDVAFELVLRGYDRSGVDDLVTVVRAALRSGDVSLVADALRQLGTTRFAVRLRGYDKKQVDDYLAGAEAELRSALSP